VSQAESLSEEKVRSVQNENERLKDECESLRKSSA
jgi:chromosome segregation ATPase